MLQWSLLPFGLALVIAGGLPVFGAFGTVVELKVVLIATFVCTGLGWRTLGRCGRN